MPIILGNQYSYVTSGLTLYLDSRNTDSYSGSGTSWYDLSNSQITATLFNGPTYSGGYLNFNGSNQGVQLLECDEWNTQAHTMEAWCYPNNLTQDGFLFEKGISVNTQFSNFFASGTFIYRTIGLSSQDLTFTVSSYITASAWNHIVCTYDGAGTKTIYVNGVQRAQQTGLTGVVATALGGASIGAYGAYAGGRAYYFNGKIAVSRLYNRALNSTEVSRNYNADATNFGLSGTPSYTYEGVNLQGTKPSVPTSLPLDKGSLISVYTFTNSGTYTAPSGTTKVFVQVVGGGGGSAGYCESGGAGGYAEGTFAITGGTTVNITVGGGGAGVGYYAVAGSGGTTSFGSYLSATGGGGANSTAAHNGGHGGVGSGGQVNLYGGSGTGHANGASHAQDGVGGGSYFGGSGGQYRSATPSNFSPAPGSGATGGISEIGGSGTSAPSGLVTIYSFS